MSVELKYFCNEKLLKYILYVEFDDIQFIAKYFKCSNNNGKIQIF